MSVRFAVRLTPRAGADRVDGVGPEGQLLVRVRAAPAGGAANRALLRVLADELAVAPSALALVAGASARRKLVDLKGGRPADLLARWPGLSANERGRQGGGGSPVSSGGQGRSRGSLARM